jgi:hypothetical protein
MIPEFGHYALILALCVAVIQGVLPLVGAHQGRREWLILARPTAQTVFLLLLIAFLCLTWSFYTNDFSVLYVAEHSNSQQPLMYRLGAVWGGHEGSLLLWVFLLSTWTILVSQLSKALDEFMVAGAKMSADFKPIMVIRGMNVAPQMISVISHHWKARLEEFEQAVEGKDSQLVEAYNFLTKIQLRNCVKFCEAVINDCGAYVQIKKVERKPRKVKAVPPEKRAAKFKIQAEFAELKLKSLPAASLVDKAEAWLYDTKKRKLIHLVADSHTQAFTVKNNSIIGFSTVETQQKTLRKPADVVKAVQAAGKPAARKLFKEIKATETAWNGRGTENLIILKSW